MARNITLAGTTEQLILASCNARILDYETNFTVFSKVSD